jgi:hypothetical protein
MTIDVALLADRLDLLREILSIGAAIDVFAEQGVDLADERRRVHRARALVLDQLAEIVNNSYHDAEPLILH